MNWKKYLGKRVLLRAPFSYGMLYEALVEEVSPGGRVKLRWTNKTSIWYNADNYQVVEELDSSVEELTNEIKKMLRVE